MTLSAIVVAFAPWGTFTFTSMLYLVTYIPLSILLLRAVWHLEVVGTQADAGVVHDVGTLKRLRFGTVGMSLKASLALSEVIQEAEAHPIGTLVPLNVLNVLDAVLSDAAIGAGVAREMDPPVLAVGNPAKIVPVAALSSLLLWRHPQALVWPTLAVVALRAYHLTGLFGALSLG